MWCSLCGGPSNSTARGWQCARCGTRTGPRKAPPRYGEQVVWPALKILGAIFLLFFLVEVVTGILATP